MRNLFKIRTPLSDHALIGLASIAFLIITLGLALDKATDKQSSYTQLTPQAKEERQQQQQEEEETGPAAILFSETEDELDQVLNEANEVLNLDTDLQEPTVNFEFTY